MKIALIGYGKMGKEIEKIAVARGHEIVSIIDIDNQQDFESEAFKSADVAIEFTNPHVAYQNYMKTFAAGVKLVSGSTGWLEEHGEEVKKLCTEGGKTLFWSSNFSLGVAIFSAVNKYLASIMNNFPGYEVSMVETHHIHKLDAPSGTARTLAEIVDANMGVITDVQSVRCGEIPGIHTVGFEGMNDRLVLKHEAFSREGFAAGAVEAALRTEGLTGVHEFKDLFFE